MWPTKSSIVDVSRLHTSYFFTALSGNNWGEAKKYKAMGADGVTEF